MATSKLIKERIEAFARQSRQGLLDVAERLVVVLSMLRTSYPCGVSRAGPSLGAGEELRQG